ncbi:MAG: hypothetical protein KOO63_13260 [Bacteroidales bacterium]|nr:hypothetical protein [Candidatus Latescibacterota bacterium]
MSKDDRLIHCYQKEKDCYLRILELSVELKGALESGRSMQDVIAILRRKNMIMDEIDSIEKTIEQEKREYLHGRWHPGQVERLVSELSGIVERLLSLERENEILFSSSSRRFSNKKVSGAAAGYALGRYSTVNAGE